MGRSSMRRQAILTIVLLFATTLTASGSLPSDELPIPLSIN